MVRSEENLPLPAVYRMLLLVHSSLLAYTCNHERAVGSLAMPKLRTKIDDQKQILNNGLVLDRLQQLEHVGMTIWFDALRIPTGNA